MQKNWLTLNGAQGQEWPRMDTPWSQSPFQIHMHPTERSTGMPIISGFLSSGFSGKPRQRILTKIWYYKHLESYFFICTVDFCPKISILEVGVSQIIWFIHGFAPIFQTFWTPFGSMWNWVSNRDRPWQFLEKYFLSIIFTLELIEQMIRPFR